MTLEKLVRHRGPQLLEELGRRAEPAFREFATTRYLLDILAQQGLVPERVLETGCYGTLDVGAEKTIALRADIDALPIDAEQSRFAHLCGHHAHMTLLLLALQYLAQHRELMAVNIRYIFQPAEEIVRGAEVMIAAGCLHGCSEVYGLHVDPRLPIGEVLLKPGELMAGVATFDVAFRGRGTHAAYPQTGDDLVLAASEYVQLCQKLVSRFTDPVKKAVLSFSRIQGGQAYNMLPGHLQLQGTFRFFDVEVENLFKEKMEAVADAVAGMYGIVVEPTFTDGARPLINHPDAVARLSEVLAGSDLRVHGWMDPAMGGEDFSCYLQDCPGAFVNLGIAENDRQPPLHSPDFYVPQAALAGGVSLWVRLATDPYMVRALGVHPGEHEV